MISAADDSTFTPPLPTARQAREIEEAASRVRGVRSCVAAFAAAADR
jgi:hypothetical protein